MLSFLFSRPFDGPVAIVASYRSDDLHRRHPLRRQVAEWSRIRGVDRLQLSPLSPADVRALIAELAPRPLGETEVADIVERAEGNAFFVEELVGAACRPGRWVPDDLADVLLVRLDRLDDNARQVVRAASVAGRRVSHEMLAAASGLAADRARRGPAAGRRDERPGRRRGALRLPARAARRGGVRRPAARRAGPAARGVRRGAARGAAPAAPRPSWPGTPGWPWTSRPRSTPASRPATRRVRSAARTRRRTTSSRRSSCSPTRAGSPTRTSTSPSSSSRPPRR